MAIQQREQRQTAEGQWEKEAQPMSASLPETADIERSIIKKFRKSIWRPFIRALKDYDMIQPEDNIAVCISGG